MYCYLLSAAQAVLTLASTAILIPIQPQPAERTAPMMKDGAVFSHSPVAPP